MQQDARKEDLQLTIVGMDPAKGIGHIPKVLDRDNGNTVLIAVNMNAFTGAFERDRIVLQAHGTVSLCWKGRAFDRLCG
jgi:hypothetical protein